SGNSRATFNAALGHHAAANFALSRGDLEHALSDERTAVSYAPDEPALLMNVAYIYLRRNEYKQALDYLERAKRLVPENPDVAKLAGWAYYGMNKLDQAVAEWSTLWRCTRTRNCRWRSKPLCATRRKKKATKKTKAAISN